MNFSSLNLSFPGLSRIILKIIQAVAFLETLPELWRVSTVQVCCLLPIFSSFTCLAAGSGRPQCYSTRCLLCTCAASGPSSLLSLAGPLGRAAHSATVWASLPLPGHWQSAQKVRSGQKHLVIQGFTFSPL